MLGYKWAVQQERGVRGSLDFVFRKEGDIK